MKKQLTEQEFREYISNMIPERGRKKFAEDRGISPAYLSDVLSQNRLVSENFAKLFGFERITLFQREGK